MPKSKPDFAVLFEIYKQNIYPAMMECLVEQLGVSAHSLNLIGVGYEFDGPSWVFPERDAEGTIIGLVRRFNTGKKYVVTDSKRGLTYVVNPEYGKYEDRYHPGRHNWVRCSAGLPCPLCGRTKWCMVSAEDIENPAAIICGKEVGSIGPCGEGTYLHILKPEGNKLSHCQTILGQTDLPILIVEGQTDVAAALDLGFQAIGRPSAQGGLKILQEMPLHNRAVAIIGENDAGVGKVGMESSFLTISKLTQNIVKLMPPEGIKDLRAWVKNGLTQDQLLDKITEAVSIPASEVFEDDVAHTIAKSWMEDELLQDGFPKIRLYKGIWLEYLKGRYKKQAVELLRGELYRYLEGKQCRKLDINGVITIVPYRPSRAKISDVFDALNQWCPIIEDPPLWLDDQEHPDPINLISFKNGILDVDCYTKGKIVLHNPTPAFFNMNVIPYDFDETLESDKWDDFLLDIFNGDPAKINLLAEWMGYNCVPDMSYEKMMIFTGRPRSGKSTVLEALRHMLGYEQCCESSFQSLCGPFGLQPLEGTLAALIGDAKTPQASQSNSALEKLLQIVGGDPVTINRKGVTQLPTVQLKCRFTMAMNELPAFTDHTSALEPRLNLLHFENSYVGREDRHLKARLNKEADAGKIINFALRGLKRLREKQKFTLPDTSIILQDQFKAISSPIYVFVEECCMFAKDDRNQKSEAYWIDSNLLFDVWRGWAKQNGIASGMKAQFLQRFRSNYPYLVSTGEKIEGVCVTQEAKTSYVGV
jgi:P4 family phage/plasmid primase-like protien